MILSLFCDYVRQKWRNLVTLSKATLTSQDFSTFVSHSRLVLLSLLVRIPSVEMTVVLLTLVWTPGSFLSQRIQTASASYPPCPPFQWKRACAGASFAISHFYCQLPTHQALTASGDEISPLRDTNVFMPFISFCANRIGRND